MTIPWLHWRNSFFGRIFLWFWFVTLTSLAAGVLVANLLGPEEEVTVPTVEQLTLLERAAERLQRTPTMSVNRLQRALNQMGGSRERLAFVVDMQSKAFIYGFKPPARVQLDTYLQLINEVEPVVITKGATRFIGPKRIEIAGRDYSLFIGTTRLPRESRIKLFVVIGVVAMLVSGLLCYWLARSFAQPLGEIQSTTTKLARGDLTARVSLSHRRDDEFSQLSDETNKMAEQLQHLFSEHQRFLADVSHELRSPLTRLQLAIGIAEQTLEASPETQFDANLIQRVVKEADQMEKMIGQLLWLSRHEARLEQFSAESIEIGSLTFEMLEDLQFEAIGQGKIVQIDWQNDADHQSIVIDSEMVLQALENICRNAIKYAAHQVDITFNVADSGLNIAISDDGTGVAATDLSKIFMPFYRTDSSRNRDSGGTGLGLSIAQRAIERHGGTITANLRQPNGLTVSIWLPMSSENKDVASH